MAEFFVILFILAFIVSLIKSIDNDFKKSLEKRKTDSFNRQVQQYEMDVKIEEMKQFYRDRDLMELDKMERLETIQTGTNWIYNELQKETDPKKRTQLQKEMERLQKQHYITKYKE